MLLNAASSCPQVGGMFPSFHCVVLLNTVVSMVTSSTPTFCKWSGLGGRGRTWEHLCVSVWCMGGEEEQGRGDAALPVLFSCFLFSVLGAASVHPPCYLLLFSLSNWYVCHMSYCFIMSGNRQCRGGFLLYIDCESWQESFFIVSACTQGMDKGIMLAPRGAQATAASSRFC